jgi:uncharacterized protein (TIGR03643 family)
LKSPSKALTEAEKGEFIMMALSDHVSFDLIALSFGMSHDDIKRHMKSYLAPGSYRAWRKRVRAFSDQRAQYK